MISPRYCPASCLLGILALLSGCADVARQPDIWEFVAVRVDAFYPESMHASPANGAHFSFDDVVGTVVSAGRYKNQKMRFSRASAEPPEVGQIYVVKLFEHIGRSTRSDTIPPEWCIVKDAEPLSAAGAGRG